MSGEQDQIRSVAERIARRIAEQGGGGAETAAGGPELAALRAGLSEIEQRLAHIESHLAGEEGCQHRGGAAADAPRPTRAAELTPGRQPDGQAPEATPTRSPWLSGTYVPATSHPSEERFAGIGEAVSELVEYFEREKTCTMEPGGKPCDHCGMCNSRGF